MATPSRPAFCGCKVVNGKIVFCALHERAENLLAVVEHLQAFLSNVKIADESDAIRVRELYYTMSTWNPYQTMLMRTRIRVKDLFGYANNFSQYAVAKASLGSCWLSFISFTFISAKNASKGVANFCGKLRDEHAFHFLELAVLDPKRDACVVDESS